MAGTEPSAVTIDSVQYQVTVDLRQNPNGERRRLLVDGYSVLLVVPRSRYICLQNRRHDALFFNICTVVAANCELVCHGVMT